jgi:menaquinone-dependent protoporphyrinogen oxidase
MKGAVVYASKHGATKGIAEAIATGLRGDGVDAQAHDTEGISGVDGYDAIVLGSAVYAGHWLKPVREFALGHADQLRELPVWLFSSGPCGPLEDLKPEGDPVDVAEIAEKLVPVEHRVFAGMLDKDKLGFAERAMVRAFHAPIGDFRDWNAIAQFAREIAAHLQRGPDTRSL